MFLQTAADVCAERHNSACEFPDLDRSFLLPLSKLI